MTAIDAEIGVTESNDPDGRLMRATAQGDTQAFARIVERHKNGLVNYLAHLTGDRDHGEEIAQEAFLRLYQSADRYDERGKLSSYLFCIATNLVRTEQRRATRWLRLVPRYEAYIDSHGASPQSDVLSDEASREVQRALELLPLRFRAPIVLRELEGWSYQEIASTLGCRVGTIKSRINRARERLRELLSDYWTRRGES